MVKSGREMGENLAYYYAFTSFSQKNSVLLILVILY